MVGADDEEGASGLARQRARDVVADRTRWDVTQEERHAFHEALDAPPRTLFEAS